MKWKDYWDERQDDGQDDDWDWEEDYRTIDGRMKGMGSWDVNKDSA